MCGRTSLFIPQDELEGRFDARVVTDGGYQPRFNIAPGDPLAVITNEASGEIDHYSWGLLPNWANDASKGLSNARSETAAEKPSFRDAWEKRPCLVLSSGFYEWQQSNGGPKQPYRIYREDDIAFAMAGLWEEQGNDEDSYRTVTILTTDPNEVMTPIHNRMPVVLPAADDQTWLSASSDKRTELCRPYPDDDLNAYPISTTVNDPSNDDAQVIEPLGNEQAGLDEFA